MKDIISKFKSAFLYAYYECYLQEQSWVKDGNSKIINANITLGFVIGLLFYFPSYIFLDKIFNLKSYMYVSVILFCYLHIYMTSRVMGKGDVVNNINTFYTDKKTVRNSKKIVVGFVVFCILFWLFVMRYDG